MSQLSEFDSEKTIAIINDLNVIYDAMMIAAVNEKNRDQFDRYMTICDIARQFRSYLEFMSTKNIEGITNLDRFVFRRTESQINRFINQVKNLPVMKQALV